MKDSKPFLAKMGSYLLNIFLFTAGFICLSQGINFEVQALAYLASLFFYFLVMRINFWETVLVGFLIGALCGFLQLEWLSLFKDFTAVTLGISLNGVFFSIIFGFSKLLFKKYPASIGVQIFSFGFVFFFIRMLIHYSPVMSYSKAFLSIFYTPTVFDWLTPYFGSSVTVVLVLATGCLLAQLLILFKSKKHSRTVYIFTITLVVLASIQFVKPYLHTKRNDTNKSVKVGLVQGNINWSWEDRVANAELVVDYFIAETRIAVKKGAKIVIWPEYAILVDAVRSRRDVSERILKIAKEKDVVIVAGSLEPMGNEPNPGGKWTGYDISMLFDPSKPEFEKYRAIHPISDNIKPGTKPIIFNSKYASFPVVSCFEVAYHRFIADYSNQNEPFDFFVGIANIQVFLSSNGSKKIQNHIRKLVAENGRYFVYVSNTGPSLVFNQDGNVVAQIPESAKQTLVVDIPQIKTRTFYSKYQELPLLTIFTIGFLTILATSKHKKDS